MNATATTQLDIERGLAIIDLQAEHPAAAAGLTQRWADEIRPRLLAYWLRRRLLAGRVDAKFLLAAEGESRIALRECFAYLAGSGETQAERNLGRCGLDAVRASEEDYFDPKVGARSYFFPAQALQCRLAEVRVAICNPTKGRKG
jgi:hypothetical protein